MDIWLIGLAAAAALALVALVAVWSRMRGLGEQLALLREELAAERHRVATAESSAREAGIRAVEAETRIGEIGAQLAESREARDRLTAELETAKESRHEAVKQTELARQEIEAIRAQMSDWDKAKAEAMAAARSAMLSTANELSNKLLEDHKREAKAAKEEGEKRVQEASGRLLKEFETLSKSVASLNDQVSVNKDAVAVIERALSNPAGAGFAAETVLENTLKSFGLTAGTDFVLQRSFGGEDGRSLRPDAIVFLPADSVLVIDSKASKFLIELARAEDEETEADLYGRLKTTMNQHLKSLAGKNYRSAVQDDYRRAGKGEEVRQLISIMWLPNDAAVEKVLRADPDFQRKASENGIFVAGPTGLWTAVGVAGSRINMNRQAENHETIVETVHMLIESLAVVLGHAGKIGKNLRTALGAYDDLSGSVNRRVLPRARKLLDLGVEAPTKGLPKPLANYKVVDTDMAEIIDSEPEPVSNVRELPRPARESGE